MMKWLVFFLSIFVFQGSAKNPLVADFVIPPPYQSYHIPDTTDDVDADRQYPHDYGYVFIYSFNYPVYTFCNV